MRHISLSTCGVVPGIDALAEENLQLTLSVSLHAPDSATRSRIMPVNNAYDVEELFAACHRYFKKTGRRISFEYAMIDGVNDHDWQADLLAERIRGMPGHVNLIPLIDGITLKQYMERRGRLNWRESLHFITQIMKGLSHAHSRGIVHRDIKPQNIMVLRDGSVKVTDFGIACLSNSANTMTQEALGSVHYISPEQAKGNRPDARSDIYSAGVVLYEMLTGRLPFEGDSAVSVAIQHLSSVPLSPREIDPDVPEALEKICMKAMASDIDRRYPTADAMLADLEEFRKNPDVDLDFSIEDLRRPDTDEPTQYIPAVQAVTPKREEPQEDEPVDEKKTQKMLLLAGGIALAAVIVFALWNVIMGSFRKEPVQTEFTVPNLLGMTIEEAEADERVKGIFTITEMGSRASSEYAEGQIVEQTPAADNVVRSNREIQIFVSTGEKTEPMQSVTGLEWRSAKIILDDLGLDLQYNWKDEYSDSITSGCVIRTEPAKGEMLRQGDVLLLYRSKGPEPKPVTVISFLTYEQTTAVEEAETLGLKVTVKHVYSDALAGTVVEQSIAQDTVVTTGAEIVLTVSDGPDPSVSGTEGIPPEAA